MQIPSSDWIASLSDAHKKALQDRYPALWDSYILYGYSVTCYDFSQQLTDVYNELFTTTITTVIELAEEKKEAMRKIIETNRDYGNLNDIVVSIPNYHLVVLTDSYTVMSELSSSIKDFVCIQTLTLDDTILHCGCNCVLIDDVGYAVDEDVLDTLELNAVPFIRRSILGWTKPYMEIESINILKHFIERFKPCKRIR